MHNKTLTIFAGAAAAALAFTGMTSAAHADRIIDAFTDPFPVQSLPTGSSAPILWAGTLMSQTREFDEAPQSSLSDVIGGQRVATVQASDLGNTLFASVTQAELSYATSYDTSGILTLEYGALGDLNVDLTEDGSVAFELELDGDLASGGSARPVPLRVTVLGGAGSNTASITLLQDGVYQVPFAWFPGVDFADVDYIRFEFDASQVVAVDFALLGGLRTTTCIPASGPVYADTIIDSFTNEFPLRNLPGAGLLPLLWVGTLNGTTASIATANQSSLSGVAGGQRYSRLIASSIANFVLAQISSWQGVRELVYSSGLGTSGKLDLIYGVQSDLDLDLTAGGAIAFELEMSASGDISPARPVYFTVTAESGSGAAKDTVSGTFTGGGVYTVPFSAFQGVDFTDIDYLSYNFDASQVGGADYSLVGGLRATACIP